MSKTTREIILRTLRSQGNCTVKDLAEAADVSPVSVRHHLANLQAENLVQVDEVRHGVGRPHHIFSLTDKARELFPTRYFKLANRLLLEIRESMPEGRVEALFAGVAQNMADEFAAELRKLPLPERLDRLVQLLREEGFDTQIEASGEKVLIHELSCPYLRVGENHPEVCLLDQSLIARSLGLPAERVAWMLEGDLHCTYAVELEDASAGEVV